MPSAYDYAAAAGYARAESEWLNYPSTATAIDAVDLNRMDQAIYDLKTAVLNVKDYGATGNGSTDDTTAIQNAVNAVPTTGGVVFFPAGTYKITTSITVLRDRTTLLGQGRVSCLKKFANINIVLCRKKYCTFQDLMLDGNRGSGYTGAGIAIAAATGTLGASDHARLLNLTITGCSTNGVTMTGSSYSRIQGCLIEDFAAIGIFLNGVATNPDNTRYNQIIGNHIISSANTAPGIQVRSDASGADTSFTSIIGNTCFTQNFGIEVSNASPGLTQTGVTVTGNNCRSQGNGTIYGGISLSLVSDATVAGNVYDVGGKTAITAGIEIASSSKVAVTGNQVNGGTSLYKGIAVTQSSQCVVSGNMINGFQSSAVSDGGFGIRVYAAGAAPGTASDNLISGNTVIFPAAGSVFGIDVETNHAAAVASRNAVVGNIVRGNGITSSIGIRVKSFFGTLDRTLVGMNTISNVTTAIEQSGDTNTLLSGSTWNQVA